MDFDPGENVTDENQLLELGNMALAEAGSMKGALEILKNSGYNGDTRRKALQAAARTALRNTCIRIQMATKNH